MTAKTISLCGLAALLIGCASGPKFQGVEPPPSGRAVLYVYRPAAVPQAVNTYTVLADQAFAQVADLKNGSWVRLVLDPGAGQVKAHGQVMKMVCTAVQLEAKAGDVRYVSLVISMRGDGYQTLQSCAMKLESETAALSALPSLSRAD